MKMKRLIPILTLAALTGAGLAMPASAATFQRAEQPAYRDGHHELHQPERWYLERHREARGHWAPSHRDGHGHDRHHHRRHERPVRYYHHRTVEPQLRIYYDLQL